MSSFLQSVNEATFFVPFVKSSQLEVNKKFQVNRFSKEDSQFGKQVVVDCGDFKTSLPQRFTSQFTEEAITTLNQELRDGKTIFMISRGNVSKTTNISFVEE
jgi:precorrin isomerase